MPSADLTPEAERAQQRTRLVEEVLLQGVMDRAIKALRTSGQAGSSVAVVWTVSDVASTPDGTYQGKAGDLWLVPSDVAWALVDEGFADRREPLKLAGSRRAEAADDLRQVAAELLAAADTLDPAPAAMAMRSS
jgi:hypothetical protein